MVSTDEAYERLLAAINVLEAVVINLCRTLPEVEKQKLIGTLTALATDTGTGPSNYGLSRAETANRIARAVY